MNYVLIKNGFVVKGTAIIAEDILVGGSKILQMGINLNTPTSETPVIDASGKYVIPGAIDFNRHYLDLVNKGTDNDELRKLNQAQIFNGTTTMIDTVEDCYQKNYIYNIFKAKEKSKSNMIDYGFHLSFSELRKNSAEAFDYSYVHEGVSSFLISVSLLKDENLNLLDSIFKKASVHNLLVICDLNLRDDCIGNEEEDSPFENPNMLEHHFRVLTCLIDLGLKYGCPLLFLNMKFKEELDLIQDGIEKGGDFYSSLRLWFNLGNLSNVRYNEQELISGIANEFGLHPIFENEVWSLIKETRFLINPPLYNLTIDNSTSEDLVYNRPDAYFYIRNFLSLLYTIGVMKRKISMLDLVELVSIRPSKLMGLWPVKGVLSPGADADIVIWNPTFDRNLYCSIPNSSTVEEQNVKLKGRADFVFVKGKMMYNGETFYPRKEDGDFIFRTSKIY
ncbi:amidohydrolase family protein [Plebeiibacterium marinum]|uniref:Amidohydrolase family protein n=1 Tax=Plebeiibacterium marinum TaxID=2992111 RepID=A0AAE3SIT9_9BACT|nr:amidohydrolase family protein [Plebeiobacterium marinum]MCW3804952.1 amidohydrolase family protein [Plebeiobacterium marinum]